MLFILTGIKERTKILSGEKKSWLDLERKTRGDAISTEHKQLIFNFWSHEGGKPPTNTDIPMKAVVWQLIFCLLSLQYFVC